MYVCLVIWTHGQLREERLMGTYFYNNEPAMCFSSFPVSVSNISVRTFKHQSELVTRAGEGPLYLPHLQTTSMLDLLFVKEGC